MIKILGLRNILFYVFLYKNNIKDYKYIENPPVKVLYNYNTNFIEYVSNTEDTDEYLSIEELDLIHKQLNIDMSIFKKNCKIIDLIFFGCIDENHKLKCPSNKLIWKKELSILTDEYIIMDEKYKMIKKNYFEIDPDPEKLNKTHKILSESYILLNAFIKDEHITQYIILACHEGIKNHRKLLSKEEYEAKYSKFKESKRLNLELKFFNLLKDDNIAYNMYNYLYFIKPEEPDTAYYIFYKNNITKFNNPTCENIIEEFEKCNDSQKCFYYKLEHLNYIIYKYLLYRYNKLYKYQITNIPYDKNLNEDNIKIKYQTKYVKNFKEAFVIFFEEEINKLDYIEEDQIDEIIRSIAKKWLELDQKDEKKYREMEEINKREFLIKNKNYQNYIDLIRNDIT